MRLTEYQDDIRPHMTYLPSEDREKYHNLGLAGEVGEVCNKIKKVYRGDLALKDAGLVCELGGVMWYAAALANDLGIDLMEPSWIDPPSPADCGLEMTRVVGDIYDFLEGKEFEPHDTYEFVQEDLQEITELVAALAYHLDTSVEQICLANLELCNDRHARGIVQGNGDNR